MERKVVVLESYRRDFEFYFNTSLFNENCAERNNEVIIDSVNFQLAFSNLSLKFPKYLTFVNCIFKINHGKGGQIYPLRFDADLTLYCKFIDCKFEHAEFKRFNKLDFSNCIFLTAIFNKINYLGLSGTIKNKLEVIEGVIAHWDIDFAETKYLHFKNISLCDDLNITGGHFDEFKIEDVKYNGRKLSINSSNIKNLVIIKNMEGELVIKHCTNIGKLEISNSKLDKINIYRNKFGNFLINECEVSDLAKFHYNNSEKLESRDNSFNSLKLIKNKGSMLFINEQISTYELTDNSGMLNFNNCKGESFPDLKSNKLEYLELARCDIESNTWHAEIASCPKILFENCSGNELILKTNASDKVIFTGTSVKNLSIICQDTKELVVEGGTFKEINVEGSTIGDFSIKESGDENAYLRVKTSKIGYLNALNIKAKSLYYNKSTIDQLIIQDSASITKMDFQELGGTAFKVERVNYISAVFDDVHFDKLQLINCNGEFLALKSLMINSIHLSSSNENELSYQFNIQITTSLAP